MTAGYSQMTHTLSLIIWTMSSAVGRLTGFSSRHLSTRWAISGGHSAGTYRNKNIFDLQNKTQIKIAAVVLLQPTHPIHALYKKPNATRTEFCQTAKLHQHSGQTMILHKTVSRRTGLCHNLVVNSVIHCCVRVHIRVHTLMSRRVPLCGVSWVMISHNTTP